MPGKSFEGITIAELLVALLILAEIATFTIPKILVAQQNVLNKAKAKEAASIISGAHQAAQMAGVLNSSTTSKDLIPYMNYIKYDTSGALVDAHPLWGGRAGSGANACTNTYPCLRLHNGGTLWFESGSFAGTTALNMVSIAFDPDGNASLSSADGPGKSVQFAIYYNGHLTTRGQWKVGSCNSDTCGGAGYDPALDPSWFAW